jgi:NADH:ubiquinone oxidoreductase subunit F (NADH-binding)
VRGVLMGGYFAGLINRDMLDATLDHESVRRLGSGLGCGAIAILTDDCPVAVAASVMAYYDRENAGQCGSCFNGTAAMSAVTEALRDGVATRDDLARLERWSVVLRGRGACATLDGATNLAASLLIQFPQLVARHLQNGCETCHAGAFSAVRPYEVEAVMTA